MEIRRMLAVLLLVGILLGVLAGCGCSVQPFETQPSSSAGVPEAAPTTGIAGETESTTGFGEDIPSENTDCEEVYAESTAATDATEMTDTTQATDSAEVTESTQTTDSTEAPAESTEDPTETTEEAPGEDPSVPDTETPEPDVDSSITPSNPAGDPSGSTDGDTSCSHSFGGWAWKEYTYTVDYGYTLPGGSQYATYTSHCMARTCAKCDYEETDGTKDHICQKGSKNHVVTKVKEGTCTVGATMRSTCNICGWYLEYEGAKTKHTLVQETVHLTDYGPYTNELDAILSECTACGGTAVNYIIGKGWRDDYQYYTSFGLSSYANYANMPVTDDYRYIEHPEWQTVRRDFVFDANGYVEQVTYYWWYNGSRYSQVIHCGEGEIEAWFAEYGLEGSPNCHYHVRCYGTYLAPGKISWSG